MEPVPCFHCAAMFIPRNRRKYCCGRPEFQRARKANWQRIKMKTDPDYRTAQKLSKQKWTVNNTGYWKTYREQNPEKVVRNRILQTIRNRHRAVVKKSDDVPIAKMDVRIDVNFQPVGQFLLVPLIAKMDATKSVSGVLKAGLHLSLTVFSLPFLSAIFLVTNYCFISFWFLRQTDSAFLFTATTRSAHCLK